MLYGRIDTFLPEVSGAFKRSGVCSYGVADSAASGKNLAADKKAEQKLWRHMHFLFSFFPLS